MTNHGRAVVRRRWQARAVAVLSDATERPVADPSILAAMRPVGAPTPPTPLRRGTRRGQGSMGFIKDIGTSVDGTLGRRAVQDPDPEGERAADPGDAPEG